MTLFTLFHIICCQKLTVLSQLCSFTRNSFLFCYIYKTVMHLFYFYTIKRVCACASVRFQSSELSRTHEGRKLSGLSRNSVMWHKAPGNVNLPSGAQNSRRHLWSELNEVTFALLYKKKARFYLTDSMKHLFKWFFFSVCVYLIR